MNKKDTNTIQITINKEVYDNLHSLANMLKASGLNDSENGSYNKAIKYALIQAKLWDERGRMKKTLANSQKELNYDRRQNMSST